MAKYSSLLCLSLLSLLLSHICLGQIKQMPLGNRRSHHQDQTQCQFERLTPREPNRRVESEAGISEYWDIEGQDVEELKCAGVSVARYTIQKQALLLPSLLSAPLVFYVLEGKGLHGAVIPGCVESYESGTSEESQEHEEQHQKIREIKHGDIVALPAGAADWVYNYGNKTLILIAFIHVANQANQLDLFARRFHLAGNPQKDQRGEQQVRVQSQNPNGNVFSGLDVKTLARAFNVETELASKLQSRDDPRERIVQVGEDFKVLTHALMKKHKPHRLRGNNGMEETYCNLQLRHNIDDPDQADIFSLRGGRIATVTSVRLPILRPLQLTAERGVIYDNSMMTPYFNLNSHSVIYVTYGSGRVQVVDDHGRNVFDGELKIDQLFVVPQNYVVVKETTGPSFEWIAVKTNDRAIRTPLSGKISVIRALPDDVVATAFRISREEAKKLKYNREEVALIRPAKEETKPTTYRF